MSLLFFAASGVIAVSAMWFTEDLETVLRLAAISAVLLLLGWLSWVWEDLLYSSGSGAGPARMESPSRVAVSDPDLFPRFPATPRDSERGPRRAVSSGVPAGNFLDGDS